MIRFCLVSSLAAQRHLAIWCKRAGIVLGLIPASEQHESCIGRNSAELWLFSMKLTRNWLWGFVVNFTCEKGLITRILLAYILIQMLQTDWLSCRPLMCIGVHFVSWKFRRRLKKILMVNSIKFLTTSKFLNELKKRSNTAASFSVTSQNDRKTLFGGISVTILLP